MTDACQAACTFFALDYVIPNYWGGVTPDLLVSGPNFGDNLGPFLFTLSGTEGDVHGLVTLRDIWLRSARYAAVERNLPDIAYSAGNGAQIRYK